MSDKQEYAGPVVVTVARPDTGEVLETKTVSNDYMLICNGSRYVKSWQIWGRTHQINVAVRPDPPQSVRPVASSAELIALLDDPKVAASVNEQGGGRFS